MFASRPLHAMHSGDNADREMCWGLGFRQELLGRRERLPQLLQLHPRMLLPLWGEDLQLKKTTLLIGLSSAGQHKDRDFCGRKKQIGATILKMSTVGQGWIWFLKCQLWDKVGFDFSSRSFILHFRPCNDAERCQWDHKQTRSNLNAGNGYSTLNYFCLV